MYYIVTLVVDGEIVATNHSHHNFAKTLKLAWELLGGIPQAEACVRLEGNMKAWLHTNHTGELEDVEVYSPVSCLVVPMNPRWRGFENVFAK
jgi:hypothetical protein